MQYIRLSELMPILSSQKHSLMNQFSLDCPSKPNVYAISREADIHFPKIHIYVYIDLGTS